MMKTFFLMVFLLFGFASAKPKPAKRALLCDGKNKSLIFVTVLISNLLFSKQLRFRVFCFLLFIFFFKCINRDDNCNSYNLLNLFNLRLLIKELHPLISYQTFIERIFLIAVLFSLSS